ncbi:MAG: hypothetical protein EA415_12620 [Sphaerobacteraceae bacterium]|nr:MAG: hypothetical protein EA415_12620 [Sphaerobacteraceae bacterium]
MKMVNITLPKHVDDALQQFLDHEVVRVEDAPPSRYEEDHLLKVKRLRHAYEGGSREPAVVLTTPVQGATHLIYPENTKVIHVDWNDIERASSLTLVEKLVEDIENLPGLDSSHELKELLGDLREHIISLKQGR